MYLHFAVVTNRIAGTSRKSPIKGQLDGDMECHGDTFVYSYETGLIRFKQPSESCVCLHEMEREIGFHFLTH